MLNPAHVIQGCRSSNRVISTRGPWLFQVTLVILVNACARFDGYYTPNGESEGDISLHHTPLRQALGITEYGPTMEFWYQQT